MTKNPFYNALGAYVYIVLVVLAMNGISGVANEGNEIIIPIMMLSLFTLSAAVMAYIFCYQPLRLFLEEKKEEAVNLFIKTVGIFATITFSTVLLYFLIVKF
jgi:hypothetical protein